MAVNLSKGEHVNLTKAVPTLKKVVVGLGWDMAEHGHNIDCDSSVFLLRTKKSFGLFGSSQTKLVNDSDIVYYGNKHHGSGCVLHHGDNLVGGTGKRNDDEQITVDLENMPSEIKSVVVAINIYNCRTRHQNFGMIRNCYARIVDSESKVEICRYNLTNDYGKDTAIIVGELNRSDSGWVFNALGDGYRAGSIDELARQYR